MPSTPRDAKVALSLVATTGCQEDESRDEQCPVCWGLLCEPVKWPGCVHHFCLLCSLRTRRRPAPTCPLCRTTAPRVYKPTALQVDTERAAAIRRCVGFSAYESQRRQIWATAAEAPEELRAMPIFCTRLRPKQLRAGRRLGLRFFEPRCREMVKRAVAPGGSRRFAAVTRTTCATGDAEAEITVGSTGRLCEIMESTEGDDGAWHVIVETGTACKVLAVTAEEICQASAPLLIGKFEELEEEEDQQDDGNEEGSEDEAVVLSEEGRIEMLRERAHLLELLNAAMELERARLEQRRLELTMLLSHRHFYQDLLDMHNEVAALAGMASRATNPREQPVIRRSPTSAMGASSSSSDNWPRPTRLNVGPMREMQSQLNRATTDGNATATRRSPLRALVGEPNFRDLLTFSRRQGADASQHASPVNAEQRSHGRSVRSGTAEAAAAVAERVITQSENARTRAFGTLRMHAAGADASNSADAQAQSSRSGSAPGLHRSSASGSTARGPLSRRGRDSAF